MSKKTALIFGITGQDGAYLAENLLDKGYIVHGVKRRASTVNTFRLDRIYRDRHDGDTQLKLHYGDLSDALSTFQIIRNSEPDEIYNLAAQSHVHISFEMPEYTSNIDALGSLRILEAIKQSKAENQTKFLQAGTSEMFGKVREIPQTENTPFNPQSPYAAAKVYSHFLTVNYRQSYNMFASNCIAFNHESPYRGENFVTKKIARALTAIKYGKQDCLYLGNLDAKRDWGYAKDYVEAQWLILQHKVADDFVIATGIQKSVRDFVVRAADYLGMEVEWNGAGVEEVLIWKKAKVREKLIGDKTIVRIDPDYFRPSEVDTLLGDYSKAQKELNWEPKTSFDQLVEIMMRFEVSEFESQLDA